MKKLLCVLLFFGLLMSACGTTGSQAEVLSAAATKVANGEITQAEGFATATAVAMWTPTPQPTSTPQPTPRPTATPQVAPIATPVPVLSTCDGGQTLLVDGSRVSLTNFPNGQRVCSLPVSEREARRFWAQCGSDGWEMVWGTQCDESYTQAQIDAWTPRVVTTEQAQQVVAGCQWVTTTAEVPEGTLEACLEFQDLLPSVVAIGVMDAVAFAWLPPGPEDVFAIVGTIANSGKIVRILVLGIQLAPMAVLVGDMMLAAAPAAVLTDVVWEGNTWRSMEHSDSGAITQMLKGLATGGILSQIGDGRSSGSISIFAGGQGGKVNFVVLYIVGNKMKFAVLSADIVRGSGRSGLRALPSEFGLNAYYDPSTLTWVCAWTMSSKIGREVPSEFHLSVGDSWTAWNRIKVRYQPLVRVCEVPLP